MTVVGTRVARVEDRRFITGAGSYVDNLREPELIGAAYATFVRSPYASARIVRIDTTQARAATGVVAVYTADDIDIPAVPPVQLGPPAAPMAQPCLAKGVVRFAGEAIAIVVAEDRASAADAADLIEIDYEPLPAVVTPEAALTDDVLLFPEMGTNLAFVAGALSDDDPFDGCEVVVTREITNQRLVPVPMETRAAACVPDGEGGLRLWASTQVPHLVMNVLTGLLGLVPGQLRVIAPDVGGGFGGKIQPDLEIAVVCWAVRRLGRAVRWMETRSECMLAMNHGRDQRQRITIGGRRDGTLLAYRLDSVANFGAYPHGAFLAGPTVWMAGGAYALPHVDARVRTVVTNTTPVNAYRGAGRPEATSAIERAVDLFAAEIGMDPAEVRRRNLLRPEAFPYTTPTGMEYDTGDYPAALEEVLAAADYPALRAEQARRREAGERVLYGIGLASYVEVTGLAAEEHGRLIMNADGSVTAYVGSSAQGQGHQTTFAMIIADQLGVPLDQIHIGHTDTGSLGQGVGTFGSRSLQLGGSALHEATDRLHDEALPLAAAALGADERDVALDRASGCWRADGREISWADLMSSARPGGSFDVEAKYTANLSFAFGTHLALVTVDLDTGQVKLIRHIAADDAGRIINPLLAEGQRRGGIAQGVGQALYEGMLYDESGNPITASLAEYTIPSAADLPSFELLSRQTPTPNNTLGAKGVGEAGTIGATPAVQNAVIDALSHLGVRHIDMPLTPERVWRTIQEATA
ncbi:MAG TPA: xanthine dehydrogenase family protein molybdopterin-binding subunit [Jiangellales bacterium]|nr:xanthine dehydrogenase family protein molybdopterin-binding subunit [Jiangellales bacterium]